MERYDTQSMANIPAQDKLDALCGALELSYSEFDSLIADNSPVFRTIKGHCFEAVFQNVLAQNGIQSLDVGGDSDIDISVNGYGLQLKTPNLAGTASSICEYKTHKTHGAKSEGESMDYYHRIDDFADFFVGLVSYSPFKVLIIPKKDLPRHHSDSQYISSPFRLNWKDEFARYVNAFDALGVKMKRIDLSSIIAGKKELLPKTAIKAGLTTDIVLNTILREENFRIWDMSIRGFAREIVIKRILNDIGVKFTDEPKTIRPERGEKADMAIMRKDSIAFVQIKGVSVRKCKFNGLDSLIAVETQLTRGRVNDHPTQSRLYLYSDFDYLFLALDPPISFLVYGRFEWSVFLIPSDKLTRHFRFNNRYSSFQQFVARDLEEYKLSQNKQCLF